MLDTEGYMDTKDDREDYTGDNSGNHHEGSGGSASMLEPESPQAASPQAASPQAEVLPAARGDEPSKGLTIIGIGASAGGLAPLRAFFDALPDDTGMTFVVVVHLSPDYESMLAHLLQAHTQMAVTQVQSRVKMERDHVYVIPPAKRLVVSDNHLDLKEFDMPRGQRLQIDTFFRSLAAEHGDGAAIILSGTGSDGAVGILSIKEQGGLLLVQAPEEAEYDGMPKSAIATGLVDIIAPVQELAEQLVAAKRTKTRMQLPIESTMLSVAGQKTLQQILAHLRVRTGHDFTGYKEATILRRLARRMQVAQYDTLSAYLHQLRHDVNEVEALYRDLLIHVTEFFRDRESWLALEEIIPQLFVGKGRGDTLRVWTVGCATGEEAYSIAILLLEHAATLESPPAIQIFASDLGRLALDYARHGVYPEAIAADVSDERLARFFIYDNSHYQVRPEVRELVLFTPHNLLQDPPFSRLDLILCRNVLIYLQRAVQERVFEAFHYALLPAGYLFLGSAESTESITSLFDTINKRHRIYQRNQQNKIVVLPSLPLAPRLVRVDTHDMPPPREVSAHEQHQVLLEELSLPSLLVDDEFRVLHLSETVGRFLLHPAGMLTNNLLQLVRPELRDELRSALHRAFSQQVNVRTRAIPVKFNGASHPVIVIIHPHPASGRAVVIFWENEAHELDTSSAGGSTALDEKRSLRAVHVEEQLQSSWQQLQSTREEYETSVEELRAANEELQSTNEEYRSTLEELETSKEELQSINEELHSVNQEMKVRMEEIAQAHSDLQNLFAATEIATLFLDRDLCVKRYTPRAAELYNLMPPDRGRPIYHLRSKLNYPALEADARRVLATLRPVEHELQAEDAHWFLVTVRPYRTLDDKIDGVVITCVDISASKANELALREANEQLSQAHNLFAALFNSNPIPTVLTRADNGLIMDANAAYLRYFEVARADVVGKTLRQVGQWLPPVPESEIATWMQTVGDVHSFEITTAHQASRTRTALVFMERVEVAGVDALITTFVDITERKAAQEALEAEVASRTEQVRALVTQLSLSEQEERRRISAILHDDLQQRLYALNVQLSMVRAQVRAAPPEVAEKTIGEIEAGLAQSIQITRGLSVNLSPPILYNEGLFEAVRWLASHMANLHQLEVDVQVEGKLPEMDADLRVLLYQIVRELLFNIVKHAGVNTAAVTLTMRARELCVEVRDSGRGYDVNQELSQNSQGLQRIAHRLRLLGGKLEIDSSAGNGTCVTLCLAL